LLERIPDATMSRPTTMVIPSNSLRLALGVICGPILAGFMDARMN
jgi:phosphoribulokinase